MNTFEAPSVEIREGISTHRIRANRTTVLWVSAVCSLALCGPILTGEFRYIPSIVAIIFALAIGTSTILRATIETDCIGNLNIRYLVYSFSDRLENIQVVGEAKFDFRRDNQLGFKRLYEGTRLPCFNVGWFILKNGAVAFVCLTRKRRARAFKTRDGCYILLDPGIARQIQAAIGALPAAQPLYAEGNKANPIN